VNSQPQRLSDQLHRLAYRGAYRVMRLYWQTLHPVTHGALVAVWSGGEVLLVQTSYLPYLSLPGGYVRRGETGRQAAARELREEVGLTVPPEALTPALDRQHSWEGKRERVEIFELELPERPRLALDRREVVAARFYRPQETRGLDLFPPGRTVIDRRRPGG
jgi:8-oxo-dGTP pyrophosphatase MutT (NUDIX family)